MSIGGVLWEQLCILLGAVDPNTREVVNPELHQALASVWGNEVKPIIRLHGKEVDLNTVPAKAGQGSSDSVMDRIWAAAGEDPAEWRQIHGKISHGYYQHVSAQISKILSDAATLAVTKMVLKNLGYNAWERVEDTFLVVNKKKQHFLLYPRIFVSLASIGLPTQEFYIDGAGRYAIIVSIAKWTGTQVVTLLNREWREFVHGGFSQLLDYYTDIVRENLGMGSDSAPQPRSALPLLLHHLFTDKEKKEELKYMLEKALAQILRKRGGEFGYVDFTAVPPPSQGPQFAAQWNVDVSYIRAIPEITEGVTSTALRHNLTLRVETTVQDDGGVRITAKANFAFSKRHPPVAIGLRDEVSVDKEAWISGNEYQTAQEGLALFKRKLETLISEALGGVNEKRNLNFLRTVALVHSYLLSTPSPGLSSDEFRRRLHDSVKSVLERIMGATVKHLTLDIERVEKDTRRIVIIAVFGGHYNPNRWLRLELLREDVRPVVMVDKVLFRVRIKWNSLRVITSYGQGLLWRKPDYPQDFPVFISAEDAASFSDTQLLEYVRVHLLEFFVSVIKVAVAKHRDEIVPHLFVRP